MVESSGETPASTEACSAANVYPCAEAGAPAAAEIGHPAATAGEQGAECEPLRD